MLLILTRTDGNASILDFVHIKVVLKFSIIVENMNINSRMHFVIAIGVKNLGCAVHVSSNAVKFNSMLMYALTDIPPDRVINMHALSCIIIKIGNWIA